MNWLVSHLSGHGLSPSVDFVVMFTALASGICFDVIRQRRGR